MAQYGGAMHDGGWGGGGGWFHFMPFGWGGILIVIGIIILVIALARRGGGNGKGTSPRETALDALKRRYANGEISREEFLEMKRDLLD
jgi:putative membrane protein